MILLSNMTAQTLAAGQSITFDKVLLHTGCGECHRANTGLTKLRANGIYEITFSGNISSETAGAELRLTIFTDGVPLNETTMASTSSAANYINNVSTTTLYKNYCCDYDHITVVNTGTTDITLEANSALAIRRVS